MSAVQGRMARLLARLEGVEGVEGVDISTASTRALFSFSAFAARFAGVEVTCRRADGYEHLIHFDDGIEWRTLRALDFPPDTTRVL